MKIRKSEITSFLKSNNAKKLLNEISDLSGHSGIEGDNDDKICGFYKDKKTYLSLAKPRAEQIGYVILNDLMGHADSTEHTNPLNYNNDFTEDISYYINTYREVPPATYFDKNNEYKSGNKLDINYTDDVVFNKWKTHIKKIAQLTGWSFVDWSKTQEHIKMNESTDLKHIYKNVLSDTIYNNIKKVIEGKNTSFDMKLYGPGPAEKEEAIDSVNIKLPYIDLNKLKNKTIDIARYEIEDWYKNIITKLYGKRLGKKTIIELKKVIQNIVDIIVNRKDYNDRSDLMDALDYLSDFNEEYDLDINF